MKHLVTLLLFAIWLPLFGQNKDIKLFYPYKNEIGINVTNVLGNVLSLNPNNASSPYGITYRRHLGSSSFRSGFNINIINTEEDDFSNGNFITRNLNLMSVDTRFGWEKHMLLSKKFMFSYGIDLLLGYEKENSEILDFNLGNTSFISDLNTLGVGVGPVLRFEFKISDRLFLSTESSFYGYHEMTKETLTIGNNTSDEPDKSRTNLKLELPQSLFFNISF
jgi:hypothetical protein